MAAPKIRLSWLFAAFIILAAGWLVYQNRQRSILPVRTAKAERGSIHNGVVTNGKVEPAVFQDVRAGVGAEVLRVLVREGDAVRKGQPLLELSQRQTAAELERARAELADAENALRLLRQGGSALEIAELQQQRETARRERERLAKEISDFEQLVEKGAIARIELEQSRARLVQAESELALLERKLAGRFDVEEITRAEARVEAARSALRLAESRQAATTVVAPLDGTVYSLTVRPGDFAESGGLLARVGELSQVRVRVFVDEPDLGRVAQGQRILVTWDGLPARQWQGEVERLPSEVVEAGTRTVGEVACTLPNPEKELLPNTNVDVEIVTESRDSVLLLPREAVLGTDGNRHVFLIRDGALLRQAVKTGISNPTHIEILDGLTEGEEAALAAVGQTLRDGMRVSRNGG